MPELKRDKTRSSRIFKANDFQSAGKRENDAAGDAASAAIPGVGEANAVMEVADKALDLAGKFDSMNEAMVHKYAAAVERKPADLISEAAMNAGMQRIDR